MEPTENKKGNLSFKLKCNLENIERGLSDLNDILVTCGFHREEVENIRTQLNEGDHELIISYIPTFITNEGQILEFTEGFDKIIYSEKFSALSLADHRNNLFLLTLLLYQYCFIINGMDMNDLSRVPSNLSKGKEVANLLSIILEIKKSENDLCIITGRHQASIKTNALKNNIADGVINALLNSKSNDLGDGTGLMIEYLKYQESGDDQVLREHLKRINSAKIKSPAPLFNKAIARFALFTRNYLVQNCISNTLPFLPDTMVCFIEELFVLLNIEYTLYEVRSLQSRKQLRRTITDFVESAIK